MKTYDSHHFLPLHHFLSCCPGCWWHMELAMFSQLVLHTSKGHRGVAFTVRGKTLCLKVKSVCRCVKWWGALRWSSVTLCCTSSACLCVFIQYVCVKWWTPWGGHLYLFSRMCLHVCECMHCMREWWVLQGGHRGLPCQAWPMSSAGKQNQVPCCQKERG